MKSFSGGQNLPALQGGRCRLMATPADWFDRLVGDGRRLVSRRRRRRRLSTSRSPLARTCPGGSRFRLDSGRVVIWSEKHAKNHVSSSSSSSSARRRRRRNKTAAHFYSFASRPTHNFLTLSPEIDFLWLNMVLGASIKSGRRMILPTAATSHNLTSNTLAGANGSELRRHRISQRMAWDGIGSDRIGLDQRAAHSK